MSSAPTPLQQRSVDPFSDNRFSSTINRLTRILTAGRDVILHADISFRLTVGSDDQSLDITAGMCIKDDVFIHVREDFNLDLTDPLNYVDDDGQGTAIDVVGQYYIVIEYVYIRELPTPKAYYKAIKDVPTYWVDPGKRKYVFIGSCEVIESGGIYIIQSTNTRGTVVDYPGERPIPDASILTVDGGWIDVNWESP